ncbi:hypothetical protein ACHWQZ_G006703 [Mnemiopsis leidyi]
MWSYVVSFLVINKYGLFYLCNLISLFLAFVSGLFAVSWFFGAEVKRKILYRFKALPLKPPSNGLSAVLERLVKLRLTWKLDKRLSGATIIDEPFNEVLDLFMRDFVDEWYKDISKDEEFKFEVRKTIQSVVVNLSAKLRDVDFIALSTGPFLTDMTSHLRIFKKTQERLRVFTNYSAQDEIRVFFELESQFGVICTDKEAEEVYVRNLVDVLLYLLLPKSSFQCYPMRVLIRELITTCCVIPTMDTIVEPDYVNQCFMAWLKDDCLTSESFLSAIHCCTSPTELDHLEDRLQKDIQRLRAMDSGNITNWRQQLDSLMYALRQVSIRYQNVFDPGSDPNSAIHSTQNDATQPFPTNKPCPNIPLHFILGNSISLKYFIDFMNHIKAEKFLYMWLSVDCFRDELKSRVDMAAADGRIISDAEENMFRKEAKRIYLEGLSEDAPNKIHDLDSRVVARLETAITSLPITPFLFDEVQEGIYNILNKDKKYYYTFRKSMLYYRCLTELDLNQDQLDEMSPEEPCSSSSFKPIAISPNGRFSADIPHVSLVGKDKQDALYGVVLKYRGDHGDEKQWIVPKTFEEIKKFQSRISDQLPSVNLPKSSFFSGLDKDYITNRKDALNGYLKGLFDDATLQSPEVLEQVMEFISSGSSSATDLRTEPDPDMEDSNTFDANSSLDDEENIPLKVLILLTDEVFDMKNRNQWFRTRMVTFLRQIVRATFGGKINLKIQEYVEWLTSPEYISEMITLFK